MIRSTTDIQRASPEAVLAALRSDSPGGSTDAAQKLIAEAASFGLGLRDYLRLRIDPRMADKPELYLASKDQFLTGYEASLAFLNLPVHDDLDGGITLQAAADTFATFPGVRAFFPEVIDDMVQWQYRQTEFESLDGMIAQSRQVAGNELLTTVVEDAQADYEEATGAIAEGGRIPIHSIKGTDRSVKFWKYGNGYKTTYEFNRRVRLDVLTPYAIRTQKQINRSKVAVATSILVNGDGVQGAAGVIAQSSYNTPVGTNSTNGKISAKHLMAWLNARAQAGAPIDVVVGNWDAYLQWLFLFAFADTANNVTEVDRLAKAGINMGGLPILNMNVRFKLSATAPANKLIGYSVGDTLEELVETGSLINESKTSIETQEVTYVRTENSGFRLVFGDTRSIFNYGG